MLLSVMTALFFASAAPAVPGESCVDPATPLEQLALSYSAWPRPSSEHSSRAFAELRSFLTSGSESTYRTAVRRYEVLAADRGSDAHVQLGLGILYATGPDLRPEGGSGYRHAALYRHSLADDRASRILAEVSEKDPSQWIAAVALTRIAVATRENDRIEQAIEAVSRSLLQDPGNVTLQLARHDLLIAQNNPAVALALWEAQPLLCPSTMHARAEALVLTGDTAAGVRLYMEALSSASGTDADRFYDDIRVIFSGGDRERYLALPVEQRRPWIQQFWERSAAKSGITVASRIVQHMERVAIADQRYRRAVDMAPALRLLDNRADLSESGISDAQRERLEQQDQFDRFTPYFESVSTVPWDDRGIILVRQGDPDTTLTVLRGVGTRIPRNETWLYARDSIPWLLSFIRNEGPDYYATYSIGCGVGTRPISRVLNNRSQDLMQRSGGVGGQLEAREFYLTLANYDARFEPIAKYCGLSSVGGGSPIDARNALVKLRQYYEPLMHRLRTTESAPPRFANRLRMIVAAYSFRDAAGRPEVTALTWIPTPELADVTPTSRLRFTYTLVDSVSAPLRTDTTVAVPAVRGSGLLRGATTWKNVGIRGGRLLVVAMDDQDPTTGGQAARNVDVSVVTRDAGISDIVVGEPDAAGLLMRGEYRVSPLPAHAITSNSDFRLFYELYGLPEGAPISTTIRVTRNERKSIAELLRLYPGRRDQRELTLSGNAKLDSRSIAVQDVAVGGDLLPGEYTIEVRVQTPAGELTRTSSLRVDAPVK